jgi:hypothetical protein
MPITTKVASSNPIHDKAYWIQHYVIKFVSDLRQVGGFLRVLWFLPRLAIIWDIPYSRFIDKEKSVFIRNVHQLLHKGIKIQQSPIKFGLKINLINLSTITNFIYVIAT